VIPAADVNGYELFVDGLNNDRRTATVLAAAIAGTRKPSPRTFGPCRPTL
jgi:hypothetical protein